MSDERHSPSGNTSEPEAPTGLDGLRTHLICPDVRLRGQIALLLERHAATVSAAETSDADLAALQQQDILLLDISPAEGPDILRQVAGNEPRPAIVVLTPAGTPLADWARPMVAAAVDLPLMQPEALLEPLRRIARSNALRVPEWLRELLILAGPEDSIELLDTLTSDLQNVRAGLAGAIRACDRERVRSETHILIALCGTVGEADLQAKAEALNAAAREADTAAATALWPELDARLKELLLRIAAASEGSAS